MHSECNVKTFVTCDHFSVCVSHGLLPNEWSASYELNIIIRQDQRIMTFKSVLWANDVSDITVCLFMAVIRLRLGWTEADHLQQNQGKILSEMAV